VTTQLADDSTAIRESWRDPERFAVLFDRHAPAIHRYLARRVGEQAADDLLAETFLAAFGKRRGYDLGYPDARPWLYGFATNLVAQHQRREMRRYRALEAAPGPAAVSSDYTETTVADLTARSMRPALLAALATLPPGDRDVLLLIAWEQLSYDETARALAIPVGTVRSRLHRARTRLRGSLATAYQELIADE
jgi:RNA polymerase sigma factor (sigma-70 family)